MSNLAKKPLMVWTKDVNFVCPTRLNVLFDYKPINHIDYGCHFCLFNLIICGLETHVILTRDAIFVCGQLN
jgi:hypothetical protein